MTIVRAADLQLSEADLHRIAARFGIQSVELIGGFDNLLFRSTEPQGRVLRLTHISRRSAEMIHAEFAFMDHLASCRVPVVAPVPSIAGSLVEEWVTEAGDTLVVCCMTEAAGAYRREVDWADGEIESYGALLGALHEASATFDPSPTSPRRPPWSDAVFDAGLAGVESSHPELFTRVGEIRRDAAAHPAGGDALLIHQDAHLGNLFITQSGDITLFDFDDAAYGTPTHDVAIVLFYWLLGGQRHLLPDVRRFVASFLRGYERHARLPSDWPVGADLFLSFREIEIYWLLSSAVGDASVAELRFMDGRLERILQGVPYLGVPLQDVLS